MKGYTLGLDIGSKSIGWALVGKGKKPSVIDIGVRVFPEGVDRDTKGSEKSKNATRREARGARRIHQRRNLRRDKLVKTLRKSGILPKDNKDLEQLLEKEPYQLRAKGLDEKLELFEFGRTLFHINQRRGFKSNRKTGEANEKSKIAKGDKEHRGANDLQKAVEDNNIRTIGKYFAKIDPEKQRIRGQYTFRSMYEEEYKMLWDKQAEFYPDVLTEALRKKVRDKIIFYQRPLRWDQKTIGKCDLERDEQGIPLPRCPRGDWYARRFRLLQDVNNLKIHNQDGTIDELRNEQRRIILSELSKSNEVSFAKLRKALGLMKTQEFNAEYEINEKGKKKEKLKGDVFTASMRSKKIFGSKVWDSMDKQKKIKINDWLVELEDDELVEKMSVEYGLNDEKIESIFKIQLPQRYMSYSRKAIQKLLPLMEDGKRTDEALAEIYPDRNKVSATEVKEKLDLPEDLRNPIVNRGLFEIRKVVNAIIGEYGKPAKTVIEMARDVKGNSRERRELQFKIWENEKRNEEARKRLADDIGIRNPSRDDIIKYNLWEECGHTCVYTGKHISQIALFSDNPEFQIEHILPYARSLDDSYMNKTLCEVHENIHVKGNKTPYEAYSNNPEKYEQIQKRIKVLPWPKRQKFLQKEIDLEKCISRELNDDRYICKEVVKYLKQLGVNVRGSKGRVTSELRHQWGLNSILDLSNSDMKNRDDHRHHAIDAVVTAVTKNEHLRRLAKSKYSKTDSSFSKPWTDFREELAEKVKHINVSHRSTKKTSGKLHEETFYGLTKETENYFNKGNFKKEEMRQISRNAWICRKKLNYVYSRTPVEILKKVKDLDKITDDAKNVKDALRKRLIEGGVDISNKKDKIPKDLIKETIYIYSKNGKRIPIKKIRIETSESNMIIFTDKRGNPYRACRTGGNHHIEIFEYADKKGKVMRGGDVVTMFEAVRRNKNGEPVIKRDHGVGKKFICSLAINELFMLDSDNEERELHRVQKITQSGNSISIILRPHNYAGKVSDYDKPPIIQRRSPNTLKGHKVTVDMLGRVHLAND